MSSLTLSDGSTLTLRMRAMDWEVCAENSEKEFLVKAEWGAEEIWMGNDEACRIPENDINRLAAMRKEWASWGGEEYLEAILKDSCAVPAYEDERNNGEDGVDETWDDREVGEWKGGELNEENLGNMDTGFAHLLEEEVKWELNEEEEEEEEEEEKEEKEKKGEGRKGEEGVAGEAMEAESIEEEVYGRMGEWIGEALFRSVCGISAHATDDAMLQWASRITLCVKVK